jgi:hypothetical protein
MTQTTIESAAHPPSGSRAPGCAGPSTPVTSTPVTRTPDVRTPDVRTPDVRTPGRRRVADRARVAEVMAEVVAGESGAIFVLYAEFGSSIEAAVRQALRHFGVDHLDPDDIEGLVMESTIAIGDSASSWRPDGALPWWWAASRIRQIVGTFLGQFGQPYDPDLHGHVGGDQAQAWLGEEGPMLEVLDNVAERDQKVALLRDAFDHIAGSARDREMLLVYAAQQQAGDLSPAETVGPLFGLEPATVRQAVKRTKDRLRRLAEQEPRFRAMLDFALVA